MFIPLFLEKDFQDSFLYYPGKEKNIYKTKSHAVEGK